MSCPNVNGMSVLKNKSYSICLINPPDPDIGSWSASDFFKISVIEQEVVYLATDSPSDAIAGSAERIEDSKTQLELLGI